MKKSLWQAKQVRNDALEEAYVYFDQNIRTLPKLPSGKINPAARGLEDNDVDAFRHSYVSGVFTQIYGEATADVFGRLNELDPASLYSNSQNPGSRNMDLWNNSIGRKYGKKTNSRKALLKKIHEALKKRELITDPKDARKYKGAKGDPGKSSKPVVAISKSKTGRNELFYDTAKQIELSREEFIAKIQEGVYPGYTVKNIRGTSTPVSNPDGRKTNNLS